MASYLPVLVLAAPLLAPQDHEKDLIFQDEVRSFLARYCAACHSEPDPQSDVVLTRFEDAASAQLEPELWSLVRELLEQGEMPPVGELQAQPDELDRVLAWIDSTFGPAAPLVGPIDPGPSVLRRLNHVEYSNAVLDLVGVDFPASEVFPPDEIAHGFDTSGEALSMSDLLLERYMDAAVQIAEAAVVVDLSGTPERQRIEPGQLSGKRRNSAVILTSRGDTGAFVTLPATSRYLLRARAHAQQAGPEPARMALVIDGVERAQFDVEAERANPSVYETTLQLEAGEQRVAARFLNDYYRPEDPDPRNRDRNLLVHWIEVEGPLDSPPQTAFQRELYARFPESLGKRRFEQMLGYMLQRAWRRPVDRPQSKRLLRLVEEQEGLDAQLRLALQALLSSPNFLFRIELDPPGSDAPELRDLDGWELASRLSFFLWSTSPDEELYRAAEAGELASDEGLRPQVRRMLLDPRSRALADGFAAQWLQLGSLEEVTPDPERYPEWSEELRSSMRSETLDVFDAILREERGLWELIDADWTVVDERLAEHYGLAEERASSGALASEPARLSLLGTPRRGLVSHSSILTVTSNPTRTSPVKRGKWVLEVLLNAPPPAPPPGVDDLDESPEIRAELSLRERLALHSEDPSCAVCHDRMDPLGIGLEGFDPIGAWRETDGPHAIDARGDLPDGRSFVGASGLVELLREDGRFPRALTEKLLTYALGRKMGREDRRAVDSTLTAIHPENPSLFALVESICLSEPFRRRRGDSRR